MEPQTTLDFAGQATQIAQIGQGIWGHIIAFFQSLLRPWNAYQLGIIVTIYLVSHLASRLLNHHYINGCAPVRVGQSGVCGGCWSFIGGCEGFFLLR